jgi:integral membrane protein
VKLRDLASWSLAGSLARYRLSAYVVGTGLCILVFVGVPLQVWANYQGVVQVVGPIHGIFYIAYLIAAADLIVYRLRWNVLQLLPPVLAGLVPGLAFVVEHLTSRRVARENGLG